MKQMQRYIVLVVSLWGGLFLWDLYGSSRLHFSNRSSAINLRSGSQLTVGSEITGFKGQLIKHLNATISGSNITFDRGTFEENGGAVVLNGSLNYSTGQCMLDGSKTLCAGPGRVLKRISVSGDGNRLEGQPVLTEAIAFDANATLTLAIQSQVNQNIQFDSGGGCTLRLECDGCLSDDATIVNNGIIDINGRSFSFGCKTLTLSNAIDWNNTGDVRLNGTLTFNGTWNFNDDSGLNGNGNIIDVSGGGVLNVASGKTLRISDAVLKGVTNSTFTFGDTTAAIRFSNVTIQIDGAISLSSGLFYVDGPTTFVLHEHNWTFGSNSKLTINSVTLWLDGAGESIIGNLLFDGAGNYEFINSGTYLVEGSGGSLEDWGEETSDAVIALEDRVTMVESDIDTLKNQVNSIDHGPGDMVIDTPSSTILYDVHLSPQRKIRFTTDTVLNGSSHYIYLSQTNENILYVDAGVSVTVKNVVLKNFSENKINIGAGASFIFGDGTEVELCTNEELSRTWTCEGANIIDGNGKQITMNGHGGLYIPSGGRLVLQDIRICGWSNENIKCEDNTASIVLKNCELLATNTVMFSHGSILFDQEVTLAGAYPFCYESSAASTIAANATLRLDQGFTFSYCPTIASKDLFVFEDSTAILVLKGATIHASETGLTLKTGRLLINKFSFISSDGGGEITFGNDIAEQDLQCDFRERTKLELTKGSLAYRNIQSSSWNMVEDYAELAINAGAKLKLYQTLDLQEGFVHFGDGAYLLRAPGKSIEGSVLADGIIVYDTLL